VRRDMVDDSPGAIDAFERALEIGPDSAETIDDLIDLYQSKNDAARLVDLCRRRVGLFGPGDDGLKFELLNRAATLFDSELSDRREAIDCLTQALAVRPGDVEVLRRVDGFIRKSTCGRSFWRI